MLECADTWTIQDKTFKSIKTRLPKGEYLLGFVKVDTDRWLLKSSNKWYWNLYESGKGKFKLQKLRIK